MYTEWTDGDGRKKRNYVKPTVWEPDEIAKTEAVLVEWKQENESQQSDD